MPFAGIVTELAQMAQRPVDAATRVRAALHLTDWLGCAVYALRSPVARALLAHGKEHATGRSQAFGLGARHVDAAALHNGCLGNVAEMDDVHRVSVLHPGPVVIPVALALAEHLGASGAALLDAIARGYDTMIRIGATLGPAHYQYFHPTSTAGAFGAASAAASLLELSASQHADALGNAGTRTGGLWQLRHEDCMSKALHNGLAAQSGLLAAQLARRGFTGPRFVLEGESGLFRAMAIDGNPAEIVFDPTGPWRINEVSFKPWAACRHAHAAIDAALKVREQLPAGALISAVAVRSYADALRFCDQPNPQTEAAAKFSLQHAVAVVLSKGKPSLDDFTPPFTAETLLAMRARIQVATDPALTAVYPAHYGATVIVQLADGSTLSASVKDAWGDPDLPLTPAEVEGKSVTLMQRGGAPRELALALCATLRELPTARSLSSLSTRLSALSP